MSDILLLKIVMLLINELIIYFDLPNLILILCHNFFRIYEIICSRRLLHYLALHFICIMNVSDDCYSRNVSFPLNSINTFLFNSNKLKLILSLLFKSSITNYLVLRNM